MKMNQWSMRQMFNECANNQWIKALNHLSVDHSLPIEHCPLSIQGVIDV